MKSKTSSETTVEFLHSISNHLSGRKSCRGIEYVVCIGMDDDSQLRQLDLADVSTRENKIFFYPDRFVFPDTFHRQQSDKKDIITHVLIEHFDNIFAGYDYTRPCFKVGSLIPGVYKYVLSFDKKRRQWVRVK